MPKTKEAGKISARLVPKRDKSPERGDKLALNFYCKGKEKHRMRVEFYCPKCKPLYRHVCGDDSEEDLTGMMLPNCNGSTPNEKWRVVKIEEYNG